MAETIAEKKTRLELLLIRKAEIEEKLKAEKTRIQIQDRKAKTAENSKARKAQTKLKIEYGGLCEIAKLTKVDKGIVLGILLWAGETLLKDETKLAGYKRRGDAVLAQRVKDKKAAATEVLI